MKKFISMVMAAAMVVSLVPATAFAANTAEFKTVGAIEVKEGTDAQKLTIGLDKVTGYPQLQMIIGDVDTVSKENDDYEITLEFDNIETTRALAGTGNYWGSAAVVRGGSTDTQANAVTIINANGIEIEECENEATSLTVTITEQGKDLTKGDMLVLPFSSDLFRLTSDNEGTVGTVAVTGDFGESKEAMPIASVLGEGLNITVAGKPVEVAQEEVVALKKVTIESTVGVFATTDEIKVKVSKGFEFAKVPTGAFDIEDDSFKVYGNGTDTIEFAAGDIKVEAVSAKPGDVATLTVSCKGYDGDNDEAAIVIDEAVVMSVDEDEDVPVMYSGTDVDETGLTSDEDHISLEVTIEESVEDAWDAVKAWTLSLPEGVYVHNVEFTGNKDNAFRVLKSEGNHGYDNDALVDGFKKAYKDGEFETFDFGRRAFEVLDGKKVELSFKLELVAEPEFEGDVVLTLEGDGISEDAQEVTIAKFVKAYTVDAKQNDLVIDYKETVVPTDVVITEAEEGLWKKGTSFDLAIEDGRIDVEGSDVTVNEDDSDMEIKENDTAFTVKAESDDEAAIVTLSDVELYMQRSIPAGAYDLILATTMGDNFMAETIFGATDDADTNNENEATVRSLYYNDDARYWETAKEAWINVITSGRDNDDASFTTKVVVPVGENVMYANEQAVALDVPAYINAAGYTMLPVRAVSVALGIDTNNVLWNQAAKQVTILYGQRVITMTVGQKVVNVNGSSIPATAAVEVVNGRAFLGMRDLATALGVTDITWDPATQTATLNGNR